MNLLMLKLDRGSGDMVKLRLKTAKYLTLLMVLLFTCSASCLVVPPVFSPGRLVVTPATEIHFEMTEGDYTTTRVVP